MEKNLRNQIWPEDSSKWFMSELDSSVPHVFDSTNIEANSTIKQYLLDRGLVILPDWMPDKIFHAHFKRWVGNCSVPYDTLQESTSVNSLYLSFFPFIFEVTSAFFLEKLNSFVTRPQFLDFGNTLLISQEKPHVVQKKIKELLDHLLGLQDPKYGFIYLVLINDENQSNIDAMGFEKCGQFWVRLKIGLNDLSIKNINSDHAIVRSDRARQIQILKTDLASADFYIQLDVENRTDFTYLVFKKKTNKEITIQRPNKKTEFTLSDTSNCVANFTHPTTLKKSPSQNEFDVQSECTLKLSSYQSYKESGFNDLDDVVNHMKKVIDQTIYQYVSGKTLFDLFCNFDATGKEGGKESISRLIRNQVEAEAASVGYKLQSFYSLPDVALLKLFKGIRINIVDNEDSFSTGYGGGNITINIIMDITAEQHGLDKLMHLLSPSGDSENKDVLDISYADLVQCIKKPIISICANVIKQHNYQTASTQFDAEVKPSLEVKLKSEMSDLFGIKVTIKSMFPVETEDASRLRELSGRSQPFKFSVISGGSENGELLVEFQSAFKVIGIDMVNGWDAFERTDFGYRNNSLVRMKFIHKDDVDPNYDRKCKIIAIDNELNSIGEEIERNFKANLNLIPNLYTWFRDAKGNRTIQETLLAKVSLAIKQNRGLEVYIENITIDDERLIKMLKKERDRKYEYEDSINIKKKIRFDYLEGSVKRKVESEDSGKKSSESNQKSRNHGTVIHGGNFTNVIVGDHNKQFNDSKSGDDEEE